MKFRIASSVVGLSAMMLAGCGSGLTVVEPRIVGPHELTLRYDNEFQVHSPQGLVATGVRYDGLLEYVHCVPEAAKQAEGAQGAGNTAVGLTITGLTLGVGGVAGFAGLNYTDKPDIMWPLLLTGLGAEIVGLVLTAVGRTMKVEANGRAVDAVNFYNDAVGSRGGRCTARGAEIPEPPEAEEPAGPKPIYPVPPELLPPPPPIKPWPVDTTPAPPDRVILPQ
jgi:hypothetical protein